MSRQSKIYIFLAAIIVITSHSLAFSPKDLKALKWEQLIQESNCLLSDKPAKKILPKNI